MPIDFNVTKSYDRETNRLNEFCTDFVISMTLIMQSTIQFDD